MLPKRRVRLEETHRGGPGRRYGGAVLLDGRDVFPAKTTARYLAPEELQTTRVPGGGTIRLEALSPQGGGPPVVRHVAEFHCKGRLETIESYLQMPHHGFTQLHGLEAEQAIKDDLERLLRLIQRRRQA